ncbi:NAD(P)-dependent oxidoreductase [Rhodococcus sp. AD45-ID]|uniref:SDR family mycofactocin-dependent oxidoreductase n=1 Tax=Nocardia globerula TaxID=1818 RepID=A0A652YMI6_NOCGL|nr:MULTISPECIES: mycofactocin-coupled SDR family oxidoreductase [Rhodococcus]KJF23595.1 (-)-trans-carveol dehydrogenase [Rhodococcus sp. AD45]NMD59998.1 mycofactocin-coupled SDR family oxidoreductase [Nocardia globerula]PSR42013.1 NAD(P)-dependent oxidoreductase [Rhodococcus sp. AD45-ID]PVX63892.1 SDR family mycofactocin-dependent oxidoreductase [Rhodococcus globerulus]
MSGLEGRVAFITGAGRGQGRAHAIRLAREGVDIIGVDICENVDSMTYPNASEADLEETVRLVEKESRRMVGLKADVRNYRQLTAAFEEGYEQFGRVDIVIANAGIIRMGAESEDFLADWNDVIDTNLTGVYHTVRAALPAMREAARGGSIVITSSTAGLKASSSLSASGNAYASAKRGVVALMQGLAAHLAPEWIRVNTIHPTGVASGMTQNAAMDALMAHAAAGGSNSISGMQNALPLQMLECGDVANAVAYLVSDEAKFITGIQWPLDAGFMIR